MPTHLSPVDFDIAPLVHQVGIEMVAVALDQGSASSEERARYQLRKKMKLHLTSHLLSCCHSLPGFVFESMFVIFSSSNEAADERIDRGDSFLEEEQCCRIKKSASRALPVS